MQLSANRKMLHWEDNFDKDETETPKLHQLQKSCMLLEVFFFLSFRQRNSHHAVPPAGEVADLAHLYVGKETECIKKLKKPDENLAAQTFGLMGAGIDDVLELSAMSRTDVR